MVCAFTGHRQIIKSHTPRIEDMLDRAIAYAYGEGCRDFYAGGALGFDTLAAKAVIKFRLIHRDARLILALPCINQDKDWSAAQRAVYAYTQREADETVYISEEYTDTCMRERNQYLADNADILIAYVARSHSGAAQTVRMAERLGKRIYNLYPALEKEGQKNES